MSSPASQLSGLRVWWRSRTLRSTDPSARVKAIEGLAELGDARAVSVLTESLGDPEAEVRCHAAEALARIGVSNGDDEAGDALGALAQLVETEAQNEVLVAAATAMMHLDAGRTVRTLLNRLGDDDPVMRGGAASALRRVAWDRLTDAERARVAIAQSNWPEVAAMGRPAIAPLAQAIRCGTQRARREAAEALGQIGSIDAGQTLADLLADSGLEQQAREIVAWGLRTYFWDELDEACAAQVAIAEENWSEVVQFGAAAVPALASALHERHAEHRIHAAGGLSEIGGSDAAAALTGIVGDLTQEPSVRIAAIRGLGKIGEPSSAAVLVRSLRDPHWPVRQAAALALHAVRWVPTSDVERARLAVANQYFEDAVALGEAAIEPLVDALQHRAVNTAAARAMLQIGPAGLDRLLVVLRDSDQPMSVREVVARTLAEIGDQRAIEPVVEMLTDPDMVVRQAAVWTLEKLGWEPSNDTQLALAAIAHEDWEALAPLGPAAVEPLLALAANGLAPAETVSALHHLLLVAAERLPVEDLRAIAALGGLHGKKNLRNAKYVGSAPAASTALECKQVRALACAELTRRGLPT